MTKHQLLRLDQIINRFDVRKELDDDNIQHLADLYSSGMELPPIRVIPAGEKDGVAIYAYIDGRHRAAARAVLGLTDVPAIVEDNSGSDSVALYSKALKANYGGAKPPTRADISHTIVRMVELGASDAKIRAALDFIPPAVIRNYIAAARGNLGKKRMQQALDAVANGASASKAAKEFTVDPKALSETIAGKKLKWSQGEGDVISHGKSLVTRQLRSANSVIGQRVKTLLQEAEDGEISSDTVLKVIQAWETNVKGTLHRIQDWRHRLEAMASHNGQPPGE